MKKYKQIIITTIESKKVYRASLIIGIATTLIPLGIKLLIWNSIFAKAEHNLAGYTFSEIVAYSIISTVTFFLISTYVQYDIASEIKDGKLSNYLLWPISHIKYWFSKLLGIKFIEIMYVLISTVFILLAFSMLEFDVVSLFIYMIFLVLGLILNFLFFYIISLLSFWFLEIHSFFAASTFIIMVLSGEVISYDFFPSLIKRVLEFLPFRYISYTPTQILLNKIEVQDIIQSLLVEIVWIGIFFIISRMTWKIGVVKYESVGN